MIPGGSRPVRTVALSGAAVLAVFMSLVLIPSAPAAADDPAPPPVVPGFQMNPLPIPIDVATGAAIGSTAAGYAATTGITCTTASAGGCVLLGGAFIAAYHGTYKTLEVMWPCGFSGDECVEPSAEFPNPMIQTNWKPCTQFSGAGAAAASAALPGGACMLVTYNASTSAGNTHALRVSDAPAAEDWPDSNNVACCRGPLTSHFNVSGWTTSGTPLTRNESGEHSTLTWPIVREGAYSQAGSVILGRPASELSQGFCDGMIVCEVAPHDVLEYSTQNGTNPYGSSPIAQALVPFAREVMEHGMQTRIRTRAWYHNVVTTEERIFEERTEWEWERDRRGKSSTAIIPQGPTGPDWVIRRTKVEVEWPHGKTNGIVDVSVPPDVLEMIGKLADCGNDPTCETRKEGDVCIVGNSPAPMKWCDAKDIADALPDNDPVVDGFPEPNPKPKPPTSTPTTPPKAPPTEEAEPLPPTMTDTPSNPDSQQSECWPSGWGLLNPVDWVIKPIKCALKWAFVPSVSFQTRLQRVGLKIHASALGGVGEALMGLMGGLPSALNPGSADCQGPAFRPHPDSPTYHPFSACSSPMSEAADIFRGLVSAFVIALGLVSAYNRMVVPWGIEPIDFRPKDNGG